jgi:hypothetical protein
MLKRWTVLWTTLVAEASLADWQLMKETINVEIFSTFLPRTGMPSVWGTEWQNLELS